MDELGWGWGQVSRYYLHLHSHLQWAGTDDFLVTGTMLKWSR